MSATVTVNEIFTSIQGESTRAGIPCTFVRLTGCNLRCTYCDTSYAFHEGHPRSVEEITAEVESRGVRFVTITGGEPLLQEGAGTLVRILLERGFEVQVETSGAVDTGQIDPRACVILDVKTPGSGESRRISRKAMERLRPADEVKFVLVDRKDYEFARDMIASGQLPRGIPILLSPAHGALDPAHLAAWMLEDRLPARLQLQIHKYIWGRDARGV